MNRRVCTQEALISIHLDLNKAPLPHMSIFSLVKGEKEHEVFEMRMCGEGG